MSRILCLSFALLVGACSDVGKPGENHPIVGKWAHVSTPTCTEYETVHADGTRDFTSGEEVGQATFTISSKPDSRGAYTFVDTVVKDNGKPDCHGNITPVGDVAKLYVRFNRSRDRMRTCFDAAMTNCFVSKRVSDTD